MSAHPGDRNLPAYDFRSYWFTYGNWNEPQLYVCAICDQEGITRPPTGVLELSPFEDDNSGGEFVPLCYTHMAIEVQKWTDHFAKRHEADA